MTRLDAVLSAHVTAAYDAVAAAGITTPVPSPMVNGWPDAGEIGTVARTGGYTLCVIATEPSGPQPRGRFPARLGSPNFLPGLTVAQSSPTSFILGGTIAAGNALHVIVRNLVGAEIDRFVVVAANDTFTTLAERIAQQFTVVQDVDVTFAVSTNGPTINITGAAAVVVKPVIPMAGLLRKAQRTQRVQMTLWTSSKALRANVPDAIMNALGTDVSDDLFLPLGDGTFCMSRYASGPRRVNDNLETDSLLRADMFFNARYDLVVPTKLTPIAAIFDTVASERATSTHIIGGP